MTSRLLSSPTTAAAFGALLLLGTSALSAGVVFEAETTFADESQAPETARMSADGRNLRMSSVEGGTVRDDAIFHGDKSAMIVVDHRERAYMVLDAETLEAAGGDIQAQMAEAMREVQAELENLDPQQRAIVEKMLEEQMGALGQVDGQDGGGALPAGPQPEYRRTGERATKHGYPCERYDVFEDGERTQELWVTGWKNIEGGKDIVTTFEAMSGFFTDLRDAFGGVWGTGPTAADNPLEIFSRIEGFPVVTRNFEGGELESETVLRSVTQRDLDPDAFEPPKGYRLRSMGPQ